MAEDAQERSSLLNCHFVSRFLTKPWEFDQRMLWYYDFEEQKIAKKSSKTLFALDGRNNAAIEQRLNELIETPLSNAMSKGVLSEARDNAEIREWSVFRALILLLLLQNSRASEKESHRSKLGATLGWDEASLDQLVQACKQKYKILGLRGQQESPFCYPSHGFFSIPVRHQSGSYSEIYAIPLTPDYVVVRVPRDVDMGDPFQRRTCQGGYLSNSSVGTTASRVVIHPSVIEAHGRVTAARMIEEAREGILELFSNYREINKIDREMDEIVSGILDTSPQQ